MDKLCVPFWGAGWPIWTAEPSKAMSFVVTYLGMHARRENIQIFILTFGAPLCKCSELMLIKGST